MLQVLSESIIKIIFEQIDSSVEPFIAKLFKVLNEEKKKHKTRKALLEVIKSLSPYMGIPEGYELYLLELYLLNYREDGNYKNLSKENFVDPRKMKGKVTPNTKSDLYTIAKLPFRGSNLEGYWSKDNKGVPYYIVKSYRWYPIFIFKENQWYQIVDTYSSSTSKQISNANPVAWNDDIYSNVYLVTKDEMEDLQRDSNFEDIRKKKLEKLKNAETEFKNKRMRSAKNYSWYDDENRRSTDVNVKFKINSIDTEGDKAVVNVDIYDVVKRVNGVGVKTPENYLEGELVGINKDKVEKTVEKKLKSDFNKYIGPRFRYNENLPEGSNLIFNFNHLKK